MRFFIQVKRYFVKEFTKLNSKTEIIPHKHLSQRELFESILTSTLIIFSNKQQIQHLKKSLNVLEKVSKKLIHKIKFYEKLLFIFRIDTESYGNT